MALESGSTDGAAVIAPIDARPAPAPRQPGRIRELPALVANQIAAGEVVERPASIVKELVENALDAGATRIDVEIEEGGIALVRVVDDGCGIEPQDLELALRPHATSKISSSEDLDHIATMGFRGEALASIASVARVTLRSRPRSPAGADSSYELRFDPSVGQVAAAQPTSGSFGTSVTVRNLFFNTPARLKFLRTPTTERSRCVEALRQIALARPRVGFSLRSEGRTVLELRPTGDALERIVDVLGSELAAELVPIELRGPAASFGASAGSSGTREISVVGVVGRPSIARATRSEQFVFVNGRCVRDRGVQHAISEGFRGLIEPTRHATAAIMIELPPDRVDVNVHPAKAEVRFRDPSLVHSAVLRAIRDGLARADLTSDASSGVRAGAWDAHGRSGVLPSSGQWNGGSGQASGMDRQQAIVEFLRAPAGAQGPGRLSFESLRAIVESRPASAQTGIQGGVRPGSGEGAGSASADAAAALGPAGWSADAPNAPGPGSSDAREVGPAPPDAGSVAPTVLQVHKSFLVTQDESGVVIIDQHALHERVMFEYLLVRVRLGPLESQRLLTPAIADATPAQIERLPELGPLLDALGVDAAAIGPRQVAVHALASLLFERGVEPAGFVGDLLAKAEAGDIPPDHENALREVLNMMACKLAVKAGDRLTAPELRRLVELREEVERSSACPHGRPTSVRLTIDQLEKLFHRR